MTEKDKIKTIKCVVWDLDNTIWYGILSENDSLRLREDMMAVISTLDQRGILQSVCSKNVEGEAMERLKEFGLAEYFLYPQIGWGSKSEGIDRIRTRLNIGADTIAFIDDQAFERDEVVFVHPDVRCYDVDIIPRMLVMEEFIPRFTTNETALRRKMYMDDERRQRDEENWNNNVPFLQQLGLRFSIRPAGIEDLRRVEELTVRTHQLNSTGYVYSYEELAMLVGSTDHLLFVAGLEDKYGSYGKIGVAMLESREGAWYIRLLLMSCRVMSRGVGTTLLHYLINLARAHGRPLYAEFFPTDRNRVMYITYKFAGFEQAGVLPDGGELLRYTGDRAYPYPPYIEVETSPIVGKSMTI